MAAYGMFIGIIFLIVGAFVVAGWLIPLIVGIIRVRNGKPGKVLFIVTGIWAVLGLAVVGFGIYAFSTFNKNMPTASNATAFDPAKHKGPMGEIVLPYKGKSILTVNPLGGGKGLKLSTDNGILRAPAGIYSLGEFQATAVASNGEVWTASSPGFYIKGIKEINVKVGSRQNLQLGPPLTAQVYAQHNLDVNKARFDIDISGPDGRTFSLTKGAKSPGFVVLSKTGETLWEGKFEAG